MKENKQKQKKDVNPSKKVLMNLLETEIINEENSFDSQNELNNSFNSSVDELKWNTNMFDKESNILEDFSESKKMDVQVYRMGFRWTYTEGIENFDDVLGLENCIKDLSEDYVFQLEKGEETNKLHYQGFVKLKKKIRAKTLGMKLNDRFRGIQFQACSDEQAMKDYCRKIDTRVKGPWSNEDIYDQSDILEVIQSPYPWQREIIDLISNKPDTRSIHWVYDYKGNNGKTMLVKYLCWSKGSIVLGWARAIDLLYAVHTQKSMPIAFFDFTRTKPDSVPWSEIYSSLESIKNGIFFTTKYHSTMHISNCPHVIVMSNVLPDVTTLSSDRWKVYRIGEEKRDLKLMSSDELLALYKEYQDHKQAYDKIMEKNPYFVMTKHDLFRPSREFIKRFGT